MSSKLTFGKNTPSQSDEEFAKREQQAASMREEIEINEEAGSETSLCSSPEQEPSTW